VRRNPGQEGYVANLIGDQNVSYPRYILRAGGLAQLPRLPLRGSAEALYVGPRRASDANILEKGDSYTLDPYLSLNARLSTYGLRFFRFQETTFAFSVQNILRQRGPDPGFAGIDYPLAPRTLFFEVRQRL